MNGRHAGPPGQPNVQTYLVTLSHIVFALSAYRLRACVLLFFELWKDALIQNRNRMQCRSFDALSFRATLGVLALRAALLTSHWPIEPESTS